MAKGRHVAHIDTAQGPQDVPVNVITKYANVWT